MTTGNRPEPLQPLFDALDKLTPDQARAFEARMAAVRRFIAERRRRVEAQS